VGFEAVAIGTKGLKVGRIVVPAITVYVVYIQLAQMYWDKSTMFAFVLFVYRVWVEGFVVVF
jgi:hypothetical protein